jgi:hypothetical protein
MKIVKYGKGMKLRKGYLTECECCHTVFIAAPTDVEFLWRNDDPVEFPTPTYKTYCPVCGETRIYQVKDDKKKKKHRKPRISIFALFTILLIMDAAALIISPASFGDDNMTVSRVVMIIILTLHLMIHIFTAAFSDKFKNDEND